MSHTPGPWIVEGTMVVARDCYGPFVADCDQFAKTVDPNRRLSYEAIKANAKLIASAPRLQEQVRILREAAEDARQELEAQAAYFGSHLAPDNNMFRILRKLESVLEATKEP